MNDIIEVYKIIAKIKEATKPQGYNVIYSFNNRNHDLSGHDQKFNPCLLPHSFYLECYKDWEIIKATDEDLEDIHPHNKIKHFHSITKIIAKKV